MPQSGVRECLTSYEPDLRASVTQSVLFQLMFPSHLTEQLMARMLWIFHLAHLKHVFTMHCGLHRHNFGCIFSHVDRSILHCRVSILQLGNTYIGVHKAAWVQNISSPSVSQQGFLAWSQGHLINTIMLPDPSYYVQMVLLPALDCQ